MASLGLENGHGASESYGLRKAGVYRPDKPDWTYGKTSMCLNHQSPTWSFVINGVFYME
jgi:hypothetical protein